MAKIKIKKELFFPKNDNGYILKGTSFTKFTLQAGCILVFYLFFKIEQFAQHISHKTNVEPMAIHHTNTI